MPGIIREDGIWVLSCSEKKMYHIKTDKSGEIPSLFKKNIMYPYGPLGDQEAFYLTIVVNNSCNLSCPYCSLGGKLGLSIDVRYVESFIERLFERLSFKRYYVAFFGGEPTLDGSKIGDLCKKILSISKRYDLEIHFTITTNGTFSDKMLEIFELYNISVLFSMDGFKTIQDAQRSESFDIVDKNLSLLIKNGITFSVTSVVTEYSVTHWRETCDYFYHMGVKNWSYNPVFNYPWGSTKKAFQCPRIDDYVNSAFEVFKYGVIHGCKYLNPVYARLFRPTQYYCDLQAHKQALLLNYNGDVLQCAEVQSPKHPLYKKVLLGSVKDEYSIEDMLNKPIEFVLDAKCMNCSLKHICCGGCANRNSILCNRKDNYYCEMFQKLTYKMIEFLVDREVKK